MGNNCGEIGFVDGGVINSATVSNSAIQGSIINGSEISASSLKNITSVDDATAQVIATAISRLGVEELRGLAKALADAMPVIEPALGPAHTTEDALPTEIAGKRYFLLGAPDGWLKMRGVAIPAYMTQE